MMAPKFEWSVVSNTLTKNLAKAGSCIQKIASV